MLKEQIRLYEKRKLMKKNLKEKTPFDEVIESMEVVFNGIKIT